MQSSTTKKLAPVIALHFCVRIPDLFFFLSGTTFAGLYPGFPILVAIQYNRVKYPLLYPIPSKNSFFTFYDYPLPGRQHDCIGP